MSWIPPNSLFLKVKWKWGKLILEGNKEEEIRKNCEWIRCRLDGKK